MARPGTEPAVGRWLVRAAGPADEAALHALFAACSAETVRLRFFGRLRAFPREYLNDILAGRPELHDAVVAAPRFGGGARGPDGGAGRTALAGLASLAPAAEEAGAAELGVLVGDAWQRQGVGKAMVEILLARARERGVRRVAATVLPGRSGLLTALAGRWERERSLRTRDGLTGVYKLV